MKVRNRKFAACLLLSAMVLTMGAGSAQAAETDNTTTISNTVAPASGISFLVAQADTAEQAAVANLGVTQTDSYINIRKEATTDSEIVGIMKNNAVATVTGTEDGWYQITSGSISGYIKAEYLTVGDQALLDSVKTRTATIETETLKVRSEASTDASVVTLAGQDEQLTVTDEQTPGWAKVETSDGEGYISTEYAEVADTYQYAEKPEVESAQSSSGSSVISYASQFLGNPYVWGGTSLTNGVDCSGFVMQVYAHYGISLPHSSSALRSVGRGVSYSEAQPGDIICYSGHVALYIGGGQIIHASNPSDGISLSKEAFEIMKTIMKFNYQNIYLIDRVQIHTNYVKLILNSIFDFFIKYDLMARDSNTNIIDEISKDKDQFPHAINGFIHWLEKYSVMNGAKRDSLYQNKVIYDFINDDKAIIKSILDYLSGMSDAYIIQIFNELISF